MFDRIKSINWRDGNIAFITAWVLSSVLAIFIPVIQWNANRSDYYSSYGQYIEYENEQEQQNNDGNNNNNNNNGNYYQYRECSWSNWPCRKQQYEYAMMDGSGDGENGGITIPYWYIFLGGQTEEMQRWTEENTGRRGAQAESTGAEKFVYAWTLVMFIALVGYGAYALHKRQPPTAIVVFLIIFAQFCLLQLILLAQGVISADDRDLEDSVYGWYGQIGVLLAYTNVWIIIFCAVFSVIFIAKGCLAKRGRGSGQKEAANKEGGAAGGDVYHSADGEYDAPQIQMTSA